MRFLILLLELGFSQLSYAAVVVPPAYQRAANSAEIPPAVLYAVAKVESNVKTKIGYQPWPWTLNIAGQARYFQTRQQACEAVVDGISRHGKYRVDIGLAQLNWGWVGEHHFDHPCTALIPSQNLNTAAKQLRRCFDIERDWTKAAGCYHRPAGGEPAARYRKEFASKYDQISK